MTLALLSLLSAPLAATVSLLPDVGPVAVAVLSVGVMPRRLPPPGFVPTGAVGRLRLPAADMDTRIRTTED